MPAAAADGELDCAENGESGAKWGGGGRALGMDPIDHWAHSGELEEKQGAKLIRHPRKGLTRPSILSRTVEPLHLQCFSQEFSLCPVSYQKDWLCVCFRRDFLILPFPIPSHPILSFLFFFTCRLVFFCLSLPFFCATSIPGPNIGSGKTPKSKKKKPFHISRAFPASLAPLPSGLPQSMTFALTSWPLSPQILPRHCPELAVMHRTTFTLQKQARHNKTILCATCPLIYY